jgi:hypothetical protein
MFEWLSRFMSGGERLQRSLHSLADTFDQLNARVRAQTYLDTFLAPQEPAQIRATEVTEESSEPGRQRRKKT